MKTPWHLWVVGVVSLLWNAGGAYDYFATKTGNAAYLEMMTPEQLAYLDAFPFWVSIAWALGVWGAVAGSLLLLFRSRHAVTAFIISFVGMLGNLVYGMLISETPMTAMASGGAMVFMIAIVIAAVLLIVYSRRMRDAGILG